MLDHSRTPLALAFSAMIHVTTVGNSPPVCYTHTHSYKSRVERHCENKQKKNCWRERIKDTRNGTTSRNSFAPAMGDVLPVKRMSVSTARFGHASPILELLQSERYHECHSARFRLRQCVFQHVRCQDSVSKAENCPATCGSKSVLLNACEDP